MLIVQNSVLTQDSPYIISLPNINSLPRAANWGLNQNIFWVCWVVLFSQLLLLFHSVDHPLALEIKESHDSEDFHPYSPDHWKVKMKQFI